MNTLDNFVKAAYSNWKEREYLHQLTQSGELCETFGGFVEKARALAAYLCGNGYAEKNIGIFSPNSINWMITDIAVMNYVGVSVGFSKDWKYDDVVYALKKCDVSCLFYSDIYSEMVDGIKATFPSVTFISFETDFGKCLEEGMKLFEDGVTLNVKSNDVPAKIVFTSGSTSFPKAVLLSIKNIFSGWKALGKRAPLCENDVCYLFLPLHHTYGSIYNFIYSLVFGYQIYLAYSIKDMAAEMNKVKPTAFSGVPLVFMKFIEGAKALGAPVFALLGGRFKYLFCGGAVLTRELRDSYLSDGLYLMNAYALSETASAFSIDYRDDVVYDSVGTILEGIDVKVISPNESGFGELAVKGDNVFLGYYNDEQATRNAFDEDGYFLTGDIGAVADGRVYLKGRKDTMITLPNGENISSAALSRKVKAIHGGIKSVKLYVRDNVLTADIYLSENAFIDEDEGQALMEKLNDSLPKYERIVKYNFLSAALLLK